MIAGNTVVSEDVPVNEMGKETVVSGNYTSGKRKSN